MKKKTQKIDAAWKRAQAEIEAHNIRLENDPAFRAERAVAVAESNAALAALLVKLTRIK